MCTYNGNFCPIYLLCIWRRYNLEQSSITTPQHPEKIPRWIPMTKLIRESLVLLYLFFKYLFHIGVGFPGGSGVKKKKKKSTCQCRRHGYLDLWVRKIPWQRKWQPTPVFLPGESHEQRSLVGYSPLGCKRGLQYWVTKQQQQSSLAILC